FTLRRRASLARAGLAPAFRPLASVRRVRARARRPLPLFRRLVLARRVLALAGEAAALLLPLLQHALKLALGRALERGEHALGIVVRHLEHGLGRRHAPAVEQLAKVRRALL